MTSSSHTMRDVFRAQRGDLEDFWARRASHAQFDRRLSLFGHELRVASNHEAVLEAVDLAAGSYSRADPHGRSFNMTIVVDARMVADSAPAGRLPQELHYVGSEHWLSMGIGAWGRAHIDLAAGSAVLIVGTQLADDPVVLARWVLHTIWTNFLISSGYGMIHATALHRDGTLLCFVAPHNSGKSTTALQLALHRRFRLLSDSLLFVDGAPSRLRFNAFPVGRVSLRQDSLDELDRFAGHSRRETIRSETKYDLDLLSVAPELVQKDAVVPDRILLFLLERRQAPETRRTSVDASDVRKALVANSMFYDSDDVWATNLVWLDELVRVATTARLLIGIDADDLLAAIDQAVEEVL